MLCIKLERDNVIYIFENNKWVYYDYKIIYYMDNPRHILIYCYKAISLWKIHLINENFNIYKARDDMFEYLGSDINFPFKQKKREKFITIKLGKNGYDSAFDYDDTIDFFEAYKITQKLIGG